MRRSPASRGSAAPRRAAVVTLGAAALGAAACAGRAATSAPSAAIADPSSGHQTQASTLVAGGESYSVRTTNSAPGTSERTLSVPPDSAFYALVEAYQGVGITPNNVISSVRTVGVRDGRYRRALGKRRLSEFLECGTDAAGLPLADQYRVTLTALSRVTPSTSGGSLVVTQISAVAQSIAQSTDPVRCASTGRLEAAINALGAVQSTR